MIPFLSGCSKIEYKEECVPPMIYEFPVELPFVVMAMTEAPGGYIQKKGLIADYSAQMSFDNVPSSMVDEVRFIRSDTIKLQGPVIRYLKSPFAPFDVSVIYFYAAINGHYTWISIDNLIILTSDYPKYSNQENQLRRINKYDPDRTLQCLTKK